MDGPESFWKSPRKVSVVVDNDSWILTYATELVDRIGEQFGDQARLCRSHEEVSEGTVAFYLGCVHLTHESVLRRNRYNLVVHESDLPAGRGYAPLIWQILEGRNDIAVCLFEATRDADAGPIYFRDFLRFEGHELSAELREAQGRMTISLAMRFLAHPLPPLAEPQSGQPSRNPRRTPADSALDPNRTLAEQFELLRVVDNDRYPAFFDYRGHRYRVRIDKVS
jgi:methionyl-tRNA formyltransferase